VPLIKFVIKVLFMTIWFLVFNATFNNIPAISWWPVLVVKEVGSTQREPPNMAKQLVNIYTVVRHCFLYRSVLCYFISCASVQYLALGLTTHISLSLIRHGLEPSCVHSKKGCTRKMIIAIYNLQHTVSYCITTELYFICFE
jgi:hypothetical protein